MSTDAGVKVLKAPVRIVVSRGSELRGRMDHTREGIQSGLLTAEQRPRILSPTSAVRGFPMSTRWSRRRWLAAGAAGALLALLVLNLTGLLRYPGGPMRESTANGILWLDTKPADQQGGFDVGVTEAAGFTTDDVFVTTLFVHNAGPWAARLEDVTLVDATPGLDLLSARLVLAGYAGEIPGAVWDTQDAIAAQYPGTHLGTLPQTVAAQSGPNQGNVILELRATTSGEYSYRGVRIRYGVGPFSFSAMYGQGARICIAPLGPGEACPGDAAEAGD
jgi:hypothetical protein